MTEPFWWPAVKEVVFPTVQFVLLGIGVWFVRKLNKGQTATATSADLAAASADATTQIATQNQRVLGEVHILVNSQKQELERLNRQLTEQLLAAGIIPNVGSG